MLGNNQFFIFSAELTTNSETENRIATNLASKILDQNDITYKKIDGCYKDVTEQSFLVNAKHENVVMEIAQAANQESVLFVDSMSNATLYYMDGRKPEKLGKFSEVSRDEAIDNLGFSRDVLTNKYYICK